MAKPELDAELELMEATGSFANSLFVFPVQVSCMLLLVLVKFTFYGAINFSFHLFFAFYR